MVTCVYGEWSATVYGDSWEFLYNNQMAILPSKWRTTEKVVLCFLRAELCPQKAGDKRL